MRRPGANTWTAYHEECLQRLRTASEALPSDLLLYHVVNAEKLCHRVAGRLALLDSSLEMNLSDKEMIDCVSELRQDIDDWTAQVPQELYKTTAQLLASFSIDLPERTGLAHFIQQVYLCFSIHSGEGRA